MIDEIYDQAEEEFNAHFRQGPGVKRKLKRSNKRDLTRNEWYEKEIHRRMVSYDGNVIEVAKSLGVTTRAIYYKLAKWGWDVEAYRHRYKMTKEQKRKRVKEEKKKAKKREKEKQLKKDLSYDIIF